ncbi:hypothetical protein [Mesobacillus subterraneus]|uniref:Uncharacterized protein n=1 Tax=Mesobacillus subterraneus TaxID=285983 RepID=A0A427TM35_9BACI|nr:hypothetical protein [Mesobacillus subterraneus]RSD25420.1 hypothetical protein EJA10_16560 [Mesobacillus subterraneus]
MTTKNTNLVSCIDEFITEKQRANFVDQKPNTIKKKELESYLEEVAAENGIVFQKNSHPTKTIYTFSIDGQEAKVEFFYRYSHYYTRHTITID